MAAGGGGTVSNGRRRRRRRGGSENPLRAKIDGVGTTAPPQQLQIRLRSKQQPTIAHWRRASGGLRNEQRAPKRGRTMPKRRGQAKRRRITTTMRKRIAPLPPLLPPLPAPPLLPLLKQWQQARWQQ
jgi:hypothetical protein